VTTTKAGGVAASYLLLRKAVGWTGTLLPVVLVAGDAAFSHAALPGSLSEYYYTPMRNILVGTLCVLGVFLVAYDVGVPADRRITNAAGAGVLGVALFPAPPAVPHVSTAQQVVGGLHFFFAATAFLALSITTWRFARPGSDGPGTAAPSPAAAAFYRASGALMLCLAAAAAAANLLPAPVKAATSLIFIFEALAIITFGISWLAKGKALQPLQHPSRIPHRPAPRQDPGHAATPAASSTTTGPAPSAARPGHGRNIGRCR